MAAQTIEVNYEMLEGVSAKFAQMGDASEQMLKNVLSHMEALQGEWIGEGSESFFNEMNDLVLPGMTRLVQAMEDAANSTKQIGQVMSTAEEEAANAFQVIA